MAATNGGVDPRLSELQKLVSAPPAFRAPPPPIYRGQESEDEDADGYPPAPRVQFTGRHDADGQPELIAAPQKGLVPKVRQRVAEVPAALVALAQGANTLNQSIAAAKANTPAAPGQAPNAPANPGMPGEGDVSQLKASLPDMPTTPQAPPQPQYPQPGYAPQPGYPPQALYGQPPAPPAAHAPQGNPFVDMAISSLRNSFSSLQMLESTGALPQQRGLAYRQWELLEEVQRVLGRLNAPSTPR